MSEIVRGIRVDGGTGPPLRIMLFAELPDDPLVQRGYCYCGAALAIAIEQHQNRRGWSLHWILCHSELALVSWDVDLVTMNSPEWNDRALVRLLRNALDQVHQWDHARQPADCPHPTNRDEWSICLGCGTSFCRCLVCGSIVMACDCGACTVREGAGHGS